jgi:hypothetical protein
MSCSKTRGKKGDEHFDPLDPPRCRANKQRGRGTYANDRPPLLGVIGRETGQVRLRVVQDTKSLTLCSFVEQFTHPDTLVYTIPWSTPMSTRVTTRSSAFVTRSVMGLRSGRAMTMAMAGLKPTPTAAKVCGRDCAISCVPFAAFISVTCMAMWPFTSSESISRLFHLLSLLHSFIATRSEHEPCY